MSNLLKRSLGIQATSATNTPTKALNQPKHSPNLSVSNTNVLQLQSVSETSQKPFESRFAEENDNFDDNHPLFSQPHFLPSKSSEPTEYHTTNFRHQPFTGSSQSRPLRFNEAPHYLHLQMNIDHDDQRNAQIHQHNQPFVSQSENPHEKTQKMALSEENECECVVQTHQMHISVAPTSTTATQSICSPTSAQNAASHINQVAASKVLPNQLNVEFEDDCSLDESERTVVDRNRKSSKPAEELVSAVRLMMPKLDATGAAAASGKQKIVLETDITDIDPRDLPRTLRKQLQHEKQKVDAAKNNNRPAGTFDLDVFYDAQSQVGNRSYSDYKSAILPPISEHVAMESARFAVQRPSSPRHSHNEQGHHNQALVDQDNFDLASLDSNSNSVSLPIISAAGKQRSSTLEDATWMIQSTRNTSEHNLVPVALPLQKTLSVDDGRSPSYLMSERPIYKYDPACPVHGTIKRRRDFKPSQEATEAEVRPHVTTAGDLTISIGSRGQKLKITNVSAEYDFLTCQDYAAKQARKNRRLDRSPEEKKKIEREKAKIWTNLIIIAVAYLFIFTAFHGLQYLQTSINAGYATGAICLSVLYLSLAISSFILPPYILNRLGTKRAVFTCCLLYSIYVICNFVPALHSLIPASIMLGATASCLWAASMNYLTELGIRYAVINIESPKTVIIRFFGVFFMILNVGQVFGNLISSYIFHVALHAPGQNRTMIDWTDLESLDKVDRSCGHFFESGEAMLSDLASSNLQRPSDRAVASVCAVYVACTCVAAFTVAVFLTPLQRDTASEQHEPDFNLKLAYRTVGSLADVRNLLLVPLTIFNGMEQAFIIGVFTRAFVGCCLGVESIGLVMCVFGIADGLCSFVFGPIIKLFGRPPLFVFGAVVNTLMIFTMLVWPPNAYDQAILYVVAWTWGFWVVLLGDNLEASATIYRLFESIGFAVMFGLMPMMSAQSLLYALLLALGIGMIGYLLAELYEDILVRSYWLTVGMEC